MPAVREHNEWFRAVTLGGRKSCPSCDHKLESGESIWSWGEYRYAKWRTVLHFCKNCFATRVQDPLLDHAGPCGCTINICMKGSVKKPAWLTLIKGCSVEKAA